MPDQHTQRKPALAKKLAAAGAPAGPAGGVDPDASGCLLEQALDREPLVDWVLCWHLVAAKVTHPRLPKQQDERQQSGRWQGSR